MVSASPLPAGKARRALTVFPLARKRRGDEKAPKAVNLRHLPSFCLSYATALEFWRPLAEQGHAGAQNNLGFMYDNGRGVPKDYAEAAKWYPKAAEQGHAKAQSGLGILYHFGWGVPNDSVLAYMW